LHRVRMGHGFAAKVVGGEKKGNTYPGKNGGKGGNLRRESQGQRGDCRGEGESEKKEVKEER